MDLTSRSGLRRTAAVGTITWKIFFFSSIFLGMDSGSLGKQELRHKVTTCIIRTMSRNINNFPYFSRTINPPTFRGRSRIFRGGGWYLGVAESMGHAPKTSQFCWELEPNLKRLHQKYQQSLQYHKLEVTMRYLSSVCLYFYRNIHNLFQLFFASPRGG